MNKIIVIVGPTGAGKTKLSIVLAKKFNGEIINADSMQIYRKLNIGTAKITDEEKDGVIHHLIDIKDPKDSYSVFNYQKEARDKIKEISDNNKTPIIVGGTGLYVKACLYNYEFDNEEHDKDDFNDISNEKLFKRLLEKDPKTNIHINNRIRIIRSLNKLDNGKKEIKSDKLLYDAIFIGLTTDRETLYNNINSRVDKMFNLGLLDEVKDLYENNIHSKCVTSAIGYKELYGYFNKTCSLNEAMELIKRNSRRYAKRQYTWFNNQMDIKWFNVDFDNFNNTIEEICEYIEKKK